MMDHLSLVDPRSRPLNLLGKAFIQGKKKKTFPANFEDTYTITLRASKLAILFSKELGSFYFLEKLGGR